MTCFIYLHKQGLMFNTGVHVVMYYYYFLCTLKRPPKWKKWITNIQIIQFVSRYVFICALLKSVQCPILHIVTTLSNCGQ